MRICLYSKTALPCLGGQELVIDALARQFQHLGHEVVLLTPAPPRGLAKPTEPLPYRVVHHPRFLSTRWLVKGYGRFLRRLIRDHQSDLIHCHDVYPTGYLAARERLRGGPPVAITSHGGDVRPDNPRFRKPGLRQRHLEAVQQADALVSISNFTTSGFLQLGAQQERIHNIPNGVHTDLFLQPRPRPVDLFLTLKSGNYFLFLGRLAWRKGIDALCRAFHQYITDIPAGLSLVIAGDGPERPALESLVQSCGLSQRVHFVGKVSGDKKCWLLQNARALVIPTREWEAFPLVLLEGYATGCPIIASDAPGLQGLVEPNKSGWVFPRANVDVLAQCLREAASDDCRCRSIQTYNQQLAQSYSWQLIAERHIALFTRLLSQPTRLAAA